MLRSALIAFACCVSVTAQAYAADPKPVDVPAGDLTAALETLARQSGVEVVYRTEQLKGLRTQGVTGNLSAEEAVTRLLKGTPLTLKTDSSGAMLIALPRATSNPESAAPGAGASRSSSAPQTFDHPGAPSEVAERETAKSGRFWDRFRLAQNESQDTKSADAAKEGEPGRNLPSESSNYSAGLQLEEIVVTAQKRAEKLLDVPLSISAFTNKMLQDSGATQLADFLESAPGVSIVDNQQGLNNIQIRGISSQYGDSPVGYYLDELPFSFVGNTQVPDVRAYDLERVEVLRGPQGTLYGDGSIGGTIRILTANPDLSQVRASVELTGSGTTDGEDSYAAKGMVNIPLKENLLGLRLVAAKENIGGWIDNSVTGAQDINDRDVENYRAKLRLAPTDSFDVTLSAWHTKEDIADRAVTTADRTTFLDPDKFATKYNLYSATVRYDFAAAELLSATSWIDYDSTEAGSFSGVPTSTDLSYNVLSEELRLTSHSDGLFRWTAGVFYRHTKGEAISDFFGLTGSIAKSESHAVFGEGTWSLLDRKVDVTLGLRYFEDDRLGDDPLLVPAQLALIRTLDPTFSLPAKRSFNTVNPRLNLAFHANEDWLLYTNIAKGFRSGLIQPTGSLIRAVLVGRTDVPVGIKEDSLWSYEVGTKGSLADGRVTLEGAVYLNKWKDLQTAVLVDPATFFSALINAGTARTVGAELSVTLQPIQGLNLRLSGSHLRAEYTEDVPGAGSTGRGIRDGDRVRGVPETTASAAATYRWPVGATLNGFVHGDVQYTSDRVDVAGGLLPSDALTTLDLRVGLEGKSWGAYLVGENLTDENGAADVIFPSFGGLTSRLRPRTYGVNLRYNFN